MPEGGYMTEKELNRVDVLSKVKDNRLNQRKAAEVLSISVRQLQRLYKEYLKEGPLALASKKRGKTSNNKLAESKRVSLFEIVRLKRYEGFGPTLMCEKLEELHDIRISRETTRQIMIESGVWVSKRERRPIIHQQRQRRARSGELLQIDGSPHAWFEDRGEPCNLLVFVDDATGRTYGKFFESETTVAYMQTMVEYTTRYGAPLAVYADKHCVFRVNQGQCTKKDNFTQFGRALHELDIELIYANSPQAKGRVERANQTLQDRLIKELRLAGINTIADANKFLETYWDKHNEKFAVMPISCEEAHRAIPASVDLTKIFCEKQERVISKNNEFQFDNVIYQVVEKKAYTQLAKMKVTVIKKLDGHVSFELKGKRLEVKKYNEQVPAPMELSRKDLDHHFRRRGIHKVPKDHPWLQEGRSEYRTREERVA
jgi:transposase